MKKIIQNIFFLFVIITILTGCSSVVEDGEKIGQKTLENEIKLIIENNNQEISSENFPYYIKNTNGYDYIEIKEFELLYETNMPMIPYKTIEIDVPLDAEIYVEVVLNNQTIIPNMNIPAFIPPSPMPDDEWESGPINVSNELGIFPKVNLEYRKVDLSGNAIIQIHFYPLSYDSSKNEVILYKNILLKISYNSTTNGVIKNFVLNGRKFESNSEIHTSTTIKNTANIPKEFKVIIRIENLSGNIIESTEQIFQLNENEEKQFPAKIKAPANSGAYSLTMNSYEDSQEIGNAYEHINIIPKQNVIINFLNVSKQVSKSGDKYKSYATFNVKIENPTDESFRAYVDLYISQGPVDITKRPQIFVDLESKEVKEITDHWYINKLEPGFYSVQAVAYVDDNYQVTSLDSFEVTQ